MSGTLFVCGQDLGHFYVRGQRLRHCSLIRGQRLGYCSVSGQGLGLCSGSGQYLKNSIFGGQ